MIKAQAGDPSHGDLQTGSDAMPERRIGSVTVSVEDSTLHLHSGEDSICLDGEGVRDLMAFLHNNPVDGDRRRSARQSVRPDRRLSVTLTEGDTRHPVTARDLSERGMQVEAAEPLDLEVGSAVRLTLAFEDDSWDVPAIVSWRDDARSGLVFPYAVDGEDAMAPAWLITLLARLEQSNQEAGLAARSESRAREPHAMVTIEGQVRSPLTEAFRGAE